MNTHKLVFIGLIIPLSMMPAQNNARISLLNSSLRSALMAGSLVAGTGLLVTWSLSRSFSRSYAKALDSEKKAIEKASIERAEKVWIHKEIALLLSALPDFSIAESTEKHRNELVQAIKQFTESTDKKETDAKVANRGDMCSLSVAGKVELTIENPVDSKHKLSPMAEHCMHKFNAFHKAANLQTIKDCITQKNADYIRLMKKIGITLNLKSLETTLESSFNELRVRLSRFLNEWHYCSEIDKEISVTLIGLQVDRPVKVVDNELESIKSKIEKYQSDLTERAGSILSKETKALSQRVTNYLYLDDYDQERDTYSFQLNNPSTLTEEELDRQRLSNKQASYNASIAKIKCWGIAGSLVAGVAAGLGWYLRNTK